MGTAAPRIPQGLACDSGSVIPKQQLSEALPQIAEVPFQQQSSSGFIWHPGPFPSLIAIADGISNDANSHSQQGFVAGD